ncbi:hypothetical protein QJQ45_024417, partial [Haematococcus lacustris]
AVSGDLKAAVVQLVSSYRQQGKDLTDVELEAWLRRATGCTDQNNEADLMQKLVDREYHQKGAELMNYCLQFSLLAMRLHRLPQDLLCMYFTAGLKPELKRECATMPDGKRWDALLAFARGPSNRPTASRPLYCATFLGTCAHLCARTARVLGLITLLLLGCAAWAAALAASIATTLDATSPATAETSAGTAAGEQPVTADGFQPAAAMAHLALPTPSQPFSTPSQPCIAPPCHLPCPALPCPALPCPAGCSECSTVHEQQQQQQAVVYEQQCKDSSSSGWAAVAGCRCVAAAGCRCVAVQVAAGCRCASVHEQQQQQAGVHVLQCMSSSSSRM